MHAFRIAFPGHHFAGTAPQPGQPTLQGRLREILAELDHGREVVTRTCGRLDAGVSAEALVLHARLQREWDSVELARACNGHLRGEAVVLAAATVPDDWDAQRAASRKTYRYRVLERSVAPPGGSACWHQRHFHHPERLPAAARALVGEHDLSAFAANRGDASDHADGTRRYHAADWRAAPATGDGTEWTFRITGSGFLYRQVRGLVGAMVALALGKAEHADLLAAIAGGRHHPPLGQVAPAEGLVLEAVRYESEPSWRPVT